MFWIEDLYVCEREGVIVIEVVENLVTEIRIVRHWFDPHVPTVLQKIEILQSGIHFYITFNRGMFTSTCGVTHVCIL